MSGEVGKIGGCSAAFEAQLLESERPFGNCGREALDSGFRARICERDSFAGCSSYRSSVRKALTHRSQSGMSVREAPPFSSCGRIRVCATVTQGAGYRTHLRETLAARSGARMNLEERVSRVSRSGMGVREAMTQRS
jgi:hypothetical protein